MLPLLLYIVLYMRLCELIDLDGSTRNYLSSLEYLLGRCYAHVRRIMVQWTRHSSICSQIIIPTHWEQMKLNLTTLTQLNLNSIQFFLGVNLRVQVFGFHSG